MLIVFKSAQPKPPRTFPSEGLLALIFHCQLSEGQLLKGSECGLNNKRRSVFVLLSAEISHEEFEAMVCVNTD